MFCADALQQDMKPLVLWIMLPTRSCGAFWPFRMQSGLQEWVGTLILKGVKLQIMCELSKTSVSILKTVQNVLNCAGIDLGFAGVIWGAECAQRFMGQNMKCAQAAWGKKCAE